MSNIKFQICAALLAACLLCGRAWAAELPPELERASPEAAELLSGDTEESFGLLRGLGKLWQESLTALKDHLLSGVRSTAAIMAAWWAQIPSSPSLVGMVRLTQGPS